MVSLKNGQNPKNTYQGHSRSPAIIEAHSEANWDISNWVISPRMTLEDIFRKYVLIELFDLI